MLAGLVLALGTLLFLVGLPFPALSARDALVLGAADVAGAVGLLLVTPRLVRRRFTAEQVAAVSARQARAVVLGLPLVLGAAAVSPYLATRIGLAVLSLPAALLLGLLLGMVRAIPSSLDGLAVRLVLQRRAAAGDKAAAAELAQRLERERRP